MISIVDGQILSMAFIESLASNFLFLLFFFFGGGGSFKTNRIIQSFSFKGLSFLIFFYYDFFSPTHDVLSKNLISFSFFTKIKLNSLLN
jgi:hypothetical protein